MKNEQFVNSTFARNTHKHINNIWGTWMMRPTLTNID